MLKQPPVLPLNFTGELQRSIELVKPTFVHTTEDIARQVSNIKQMDPCLKIVSLDEGNELPQGSEGEVLIRGDATMLGYYDNPCATTEAFTEDGWYRSGDVGYCDKDGNLFIVDRIKELIKYKAFQVAPAELEDLLLQHDGVADVDVIGVPHDFDELVRAYIVRQPGSDVTAEELIKYVADNTVYYKHLRGGVRFIDEIPKLASGKILRRVLKDMAVAENAKTF